MKRPPPLVITPATRYVPSADEATALQSCDPGILAFVHVVPLSVEMNMPPPVSQAANFEPSDDDETPDQPVAVGILLTTDHVTPESVDNFTGPK